MAARQGIGTGSAALASKNNTDSAQKKSKRFRCEVQSLLIQEDYTTLKIEATQLRAKADMVKIKTMLTE